MSEIRRIAETTWIPEEGERGAITLLQCITTVCYKADRDNRARLGCDSQIAAYVREAFQIERAITGAGEKLSEQTGLPNGGER